MAVLIASVTVNTVELLVVTADTACTASDWSITAVDDIAGNVLVVDAVQTAPAVFALEVNGLLPGMDYVVSATFDDGMNPPNADSFDLAVSASALSADGEPFIHTTGGVLPYPYGLLEALTFAFGKESQTMAGVPACTTTANFAVGDVNLFVTSTFGFPDSGSLWAPGQKKLTYTSKTDTAFVGVAKGQEDYLALSDRSQLTLVSRDVTPPGYGYTWR